jgi:hypothetical protein
MGKLLHTQKPVIKIDERKKKSKPNGDYSDEKRKHFYIDLPS